MKKLSLTALAATATLALAAPAAAADFSFVGTFADGDAVQFFDFTVGAPSTVSLISYSYAGGTNAAGASIARGGFDPILSLYDKTTGNLINYNDDGAGSPTDTSGAAYDTFFVQMLAAGSYRVALSVYSNFGPSNLSGTFGGSGHTDFSDVSGAANNPRDGHWAFDVLNVNSAVQTGVPEPATWGLMISGFGLAGVALRRRRQSVFA